jgi:hypothetical protein
VGSHSCWRLAMRDCEDARMGNSRHARMRDSARMRGNARMRGCEGRRLRAPVTPVSRRRDRGSCEAAGPGAPLPRPSRACVAFLVPAFLPAQCVPPGPVERVFHNDLHGCGAPTPPRHYRTAFLSLSLLSFSLSPFSLSPLSLSSCSLFIVLSLPPSSLSLSLYSSFSLTHTLSISISPLSHTPSPSRDSGIKERFQDCNAQLHATEHSQRPRYAPYDIM